MPPSEVMENMNTAVSEVTLALLEKEDTKRKKKADKATTATFVRRRRERHVERQLGIAAQEDEEGLTYGHGMLEHQ